MQEFYKTLNKQNDENVRNIDEKLIFPRVLMICLSHAWGGLEQIAVQDAIDLASQGVDISFLCYSGSSIEKKLDEEGVNKISIDFRPRNYFDFRLKKILKNYCSEFEIQVIHFHQPSLIGSIAPWFLNDRSIVLVATRHIRSGHSKKSLLHKIFYRRLDAMVVMSEALKQNVLETHPLRERQVKILHYGIDFSRFDSERVSGFEMRKKWGIQENEFVIGVVGRIDPQKGQDLFLKAASHLMNQRIKNLRFVIVGEPTREMGDEYLESLKHLAGQLQIIDSVLFVGFESEIPEVMKALDLFVMPSFEETFGMVAIEAMAMKTPIIISSGGSADEIVGKNQEFGLVFRSQDAFDLRTNALAILDGKGFLTSMLEQALIHVKKQFDIKNRVLQTLDLYEWLIRRRRKKRIRLKSKDAFD